MPLYLNKPYPYLDDSRRDFISYFFIGAFVAIFLTVFQPFEIDQWVTAHKTAKLIGFGLISFLVPWLLRLLFPVLFPGKAVEKSWTVLKEILTILIVLTCIALCNLFYGRMLNIMPFNPSAFITAFTFTFLVGVFPVSMHVVLKHNRLLRLNLEQSSALNMELERRQRAVQQVPGPTPPGSEDEHSQIILTAENEKDTITIKPVQLLFIESADNYSTIFYTENSSIKKLLLRSSLKRLEGQIRNPNVVRCHRTYIVNLNNVTKAEGNAAGYRLFLSGSDETVPVSRNYILLLHEHLKAYKSETGSLN